jgi:hypothetical protein
MRLLMVVVLLQFLPYFRHYAAVRLIAIAPEEQDSECAGHTLLPTGASPERAVMTGIS